MSNFRESLQESRDSLYRYCIALEDELNRLEDTLLLLELCESCWHDTAQHNSELRKFELLFFSLQPRLALQVDEMRFYLNEIKKTLNRF